MSGKEGRGPVWNPLLIGVAAIVAIPLLGGAILLAVGALGPERVDPESFVATPQPQQVAANDPVVAAPEAADLTSIEDVSAELASGFAGDVVDARGRVAGEQRPAPEIVTDDACLLEWATANAAPLAASGAYQVVDVCDRPTAVLAGPAGSDSKVLVYGSLEDTAPDGMREVIASTKAEKVAFVAVRTTDGEAQLLATTVLPD